MSFKLVKCTECATQVMLGRSRCDECRSADPANHNCYTTESQRGFGIGYSAAQLQAVADRHAMAKGLDYMAEKLARLEALIAKIEDLERSSIGADHFGDRVSYALKLYREGK